jgi:hypothetical protein
MAWNASNWHQSNWFKGYWDESGGPTPAPALHPQWRIHRLGLGLGLLYRPLTFPR